MLDHMLTNSGQAIPQITDEFHSLPDVGWYGSAYTLTCCSFQLLFGKLYTLYAVKAVMLTSVLLFELGSVLCGAAPSSAAFIIGRAIAGVGAAGIFAGCDLATSQKIVEEWHDAAAYVFPHLKRSQAQLQFICDIEGE
ncbi:hypothetical protein MPH_09051 [Macrophomina phaseolina MS6]|uniref:Major facilitator superfamily (MFS) profile domain-containing protein n=1 Tax=Macrophomina phaseolina (strain MS6) TaxID=1126212 RepID=K2RU76_MACPH|nr:hypothetical protein MPH_09051 [Macrophomina phaseolina MS6]